MPEGKTPAKPAPTTDRHSSPDHRKRQFARYLRSKYGNWIYLTPMVLGGAATALAAAWKFLGLGNPANGQGPVDSLYALARRIRKVGTEAELSEIEEEIDEILKAQRVRSSEGDESAMDDVTLNVAAHRLEDLIHERRAVLTKAAAVSAA